MYLKNREKWTKINLPKKELEGVELILLLSLLVVSSIKGKLAGALFDDEFSCEKIMSITLNYIYIVFNVN